MRLKTWLNVLAALGLGLVMAIPGTAENAAGVWPVAGLSGVPSRIVEQVDDARLVTLVGNVHPRLRAGTDLGRVDPGRLLERVVMVLKRSPEQELALASFNERQHDPASPDFHHWLRAGEFGRLYGPSDADIAAISGWLQLNGMQIIEVGAGRVYIQFTGTVADVEKALHVEMHRYLIDGTIHLANDRDPRIPVALSSVVSGVASLHDFFPARLSRQGSYVQRALNSRNVPVVRPDFGYTDGSTGYQREDLTPYDVAAIYNILPLWNAAAPINGSGVKVAVVGLSDVQQTDFNTYRSSFGLPASTLTTLHGGADPGLTASQLEDTADVELAGATAPGAQIVLVSDASTATTNGLVIAMLYVVNNAVAPILAVGSGECELRNGTAGNSLFNQTFQQAATAGISVFAAAGDSGSAGCTPSTGVAPPDGDKYGLAVSGLASSPYVTAVGGTDLQWPFTEATTPASTYWNASNDAHGASAKGYMPEMAWNATCSNPMLLLIYSSFTNTEALCNTAIGAIPALVDIAAGGGGVSNCTSNSTTPTSTTWDPTSCSGGYTKPTWQAGVAGIPADGKRDLPDVSLFASAGFGQLDNTGIPGSALLICAASASPQKSCDYSNPAHIIYQEAGGTSAAAAMMAGIMAMVVQKAGTRQGLANPVLYGLAAKQNYAVCNSNEVQAGNACIFYDTTTGTNAMDCVTGARDCSTGTSGDTVGILSGYATAAGYDLATGLGSINVANLVNAWPTPAAPTFNASKNQLSIPVITIGSATYSNMVVVVGKVVSGPTGASSHGVPSYDPASGEMVVPVVTLGNNTYYNVVITVASILSLGGLDTYDGAHLNIPFVTVLGGAAYTHVVVTVRSIVGVAGGLQTLAEDQYNPATGQLTIPAVFAYGKVYTNVVVTVGTVVSFGS